MKLVVVCEQKKIVIRTVSWIDKNYLFEISAIIMVEEKAFASFACQRCLQPIRLDDTFNYLGEHVLAELSLPIHSNPDVDLESQSTSLDTYVQPCRLSDSGNGTNGFMLISDTGEIETISNQMKIRATLFDTLSGNSNIDHPLCDECSDTLLEMVDTQINVTQTDYNDYLSYLRKLENTPQDIDLEALEKELDDLNNEEKRLMDELNVMKLEENEVLENIKTQNLETKRIDEQEKHYWLEYAKHYQDIVKADDECSSIKSQLAYTEALLTKFRSTNVFNATFHIWYSGPFGTINKFRLGRLSAVPVDWSEINAAWGQTALLVHALARKMGLTFNKYKLVPYGNHSHIEVLADQKELPLYGSGGVRYFWDNKFDSAMVIFIDLVLQIMEKLGSTDQFCLPYKMHKNVGKIEETKNQTVCSIKIQLNSEEQWTKAIKFLLTNIKWMLAWVSNYGIPETTEKI